MSLVPFGEEIYDTIVDINNGQSTQSFRQGDDAEFDVDVDANSVSISIDVNEVDMDQNGYSGASTTANVWGFSTSDTFDVSGSITLDNTDSGGSTTEAYLYAFGQTFDIPNSSTGYPHTVDVSNVNITDGDITLDPTDGFGIYVSSATITITWGRSPGTTVNSITKT